MIAALYTAPIIEPLTREELNLHLRIEDEVLVEHNLIDSLLRSAREHVEDVTRRAILTQTWDYYLDEWPSSDYIKLPFGNLASVTSISWKDDDGTETTLTLTTDYLVETNGEQCGRIVLPYGETWPSGTLYPSNPIKIRFVCGWTTRALVPYKIKAAILMVCADMYEQRGERIVGQSVHENGAAARLLASSKLWDEF